MIIQTIFKLFVLIVLSQIAMFLAVSTFFLLQGIISEIKSKKEIK